MKILFVINELSYFLAHREKLAKDALENGHEVMVASGDCCAVDIEKLHPKIELIKLNLDKHRFRPIADTRLVFSLVNIIIRNRPDIVHCFTIKPILVGGLATVLTKFLGVSSRLVWTFSGLGKIYEASQGSHKNRPEQAEHAPLRFLMATRLINAKGVNEYLTAAKHFRSGGLAHFMLAGIIHETNPDSVDQNQIELAHQAGDIEFLGEISQDDMAELLPRTDVFCLPTQLKEGLPRSLLEAAACGVALIGSDQQTIATMVVPGKTGWLIDPFDIDSILGAVNEAIQNRKKTAQYGIAARQNLESLPVTTEAVWTEFEQIYEATDST